MRAIGRRGRGRGELEMRLRLGLVGDTLYVDDAATMWITLFRRSGELLGTVPAGGVQVAVAVPPRPIRVGPSSA